MDDIEVSGETPPPLRASGRAAQRLIGLVDGHRLSPTQLRIAQYLVDHLPDAVFLSSVDLARRAGVSQPSVTRFAMALGFPGYSALREAVRAVAFGGEPAPPAGDNSLQALVATEIGNLDALRTELADPAAVVDMGRRLAASDPLPVLGGYGEDPVASYFARAAARTHPGVRLLVPGGDAPERIAGAREDGAVWLLAFVPPRHAGEAAPALRLAREVGLRVAVVTGSAPVLPGADPDVVLAAPADSYAALMVLAAVLLQVMADTVPVRGEDHRLEFAGDR